LRPGVESRLRIGRASISATSALEFIYYQKFAAQRSTGYDQTVSLRTPLARMTPFISIGRTRTHKRPNFEIDERVEQMREAIDGGVELQVGSRVRLTTRAGRYQSRFGQTDSDFHGGVLNNSADTLATELGIRLTPLTTFIARFDRVKARFSTAGRVRDNDAVGVTGGFLLKPAALISGTVEVGYRRVAALDRTVQDFGGFVASIQTAYQFRESTRIAVNLGRSIEYSVDDTQPYFVNFGGDLSVTQAVGGRWDVVTRYGRTLLSYRTRLGLLVDAGVEGRKDRQLLYGTGVGFRVTPKVRAGFDVNYVRRLSADDSRKYDGYRFGGSFNYAY
jgi:hypothetical protein